MKKQIHKNLILGIFLFPFLVTGSVQTNAGGKLMYPIQIMSKLECRFEKFSDLSSNCKQQLPILKTKDYEKYAEENDGFNDYTRIYTVLWGASYKYGWDVGNGGHIGVDIATAEGTPVHSIYDGKVIVAKNMIARGNAVSIEHSIGGKTVISNYAHLSKIDVEEGDTVEAGDKVGEVGNTGNSTGNHLHFQIDLKSKFHPYYYDYNECPYSYSEISEKGVCFDVLQKHTIDPLLFLETEGAVLDNIEVKTSKVDTKKVSVKAPQDSGKESATELSSAFDMSIFDRTVYTGYEASDIKKVQQIFKDLGVYKGKINGNYDDILDTIVSYQLTKGIIASKADAGTGYFGPKTRAQAKQDYEGYLLAGVEVSGSEDVIVSKFNAPKKIDKTKLLTREQIDTKETENFLKSYDIVWSFDDIGNGISVGQNKLIHLTITDRKGKAFKGNMPTNMTFEFDKEIISVFPNKLYYFTDGKRDIKVTGLKNGDSALKIKLGEKVLKEYKYKVIGTDVKIFPESGKIDMAEKAVLGEVNTGTIKFKDTGGKELVSVKFNGKYKLVATNDMEFCLKKGSIKDIKRVYQKSCSDDKYTSQTEFTYEDTVGGILVFDYKVKSAEGKITLSGASSGRTLATKSVQGSAPKDLTKKYDYYDEVMSMIRTGVVNGINKGYFLQDRELTEADAVEWIENTLVYMKAETSDIKLKKQIDTKITSIQEEQVSSFTAISRKGFLEKVYEYLVFEDPEYTTIDFKDLSSAENKKANAVFDKNNTWKDEFGKTSFRPEKKLTRGEGAYFLSELLEKSKEVFVTIK